jgi:hypothetical protein
VSSRSGTAATSTAPADGSPFHARRSWCFTRCSDAVTVSLRRFAEFVGDEGGGMRRLCLLACVLGTLFASAPAAAAGDWVIQRPPLPAGASGALSGVWCTSAIVCTAVGFMQTAQGQLTLAERWDGTQWTRQSTPNRPGVDSSLSGVSCPSATACVAVGWSTNRRAMTTTLLIERWNGTNWSIEPVRSPAEATSSALWSVSCPSTSFCVAGGDLHSLFAPLSGPALIEVWDGTGWSQTTPIGAKSVAELRGVSCSSTTACTAVGTFLTNEHRSADLVEQWNGMSWSTHTTASVAGVTTLVGVSCSDPTACSAVGTEFNIPGGQLTTPIADTWNGMTWSAHHVPNPGGGDFTTLSGVSCSSATSCTAVGSFSYVDSNGVPDLVATLTEIWDGTGWSVEPTPSAGDTFDALGGVSCWSSQACMAVGESRNLGQSPPSPALAEYRTG